MPLFLKQMMLVLPGAFPEYFVYRAETGSVH